MKMSVLKPKNKTRKSSLLLKRFRKLHRSAAALLFVFFFVVAVSGLTLGWKKHAGNLIMPITQKSEVVAFSEWQDLSNLEMVAVEALQQHLTKRNSSLKVPKIERIDIRKKDGIAKFLFDEGNWEIQLSGKTAAVLSIGKRHSDWVERLHDGSILDDLLNTPNSILKLLYSNVMGIGLLLFTITGFWMWYGPKRLRKELHK